MYGNYSYIAMLAWTELEILIALKYNR